MNSFPSPLAAAALHTGAHYRPISRATPFGHGRRPHPGSHRHGGGLLLRQQRSAVAVPVGGQSSTKVPRVPLRLQSKQHRAGPAAKCIPLLLKRWRCCLAMSAFHMFCSVLYQQHTQSPPVHIEYIARCTGRRMFMQGFACDFHSTSYQSFFSSLHLVRASHDEMRYLTWNKCELLPNLSGAICIKRFLNLWHLAVGRHAGSSFNVPQWVRLDLEYVPRSKSFD